jgi:hypothetical protein
MILPERQQQVFKETDIGDRSGLSEKHLRRFDRAMFFTTSETSYKEAWDCPAFVDG